MYHYANGFSISVNEQKNEFLLCCKQRAPVVLDDGSIDGSESFDVARIALTKESFIALRQLLDNISIE